MKEKLGCLNIEKSLVKRDELGDVKKCLITSDEFGDIEANSFE